MVNGVIDREGNTWTIQEALDKCLEIGYPRAFIEAAVNYAERKWTGRAHVTDLITCPRQAALKYTSSYPIILDKTVDSMIGTSMHRFFTAGKDAYHNVKIWNDYIIGELDLIEKVLNEWVIYDFKVVKSYPVKKALGIYKEDVPIVDDEGIPITFKSGARKGQQKTRKEIRVDPEKRDVVAYNKQLNMYRFLLKNHSCSQKELEGVDVRKMKIMQLLKEAGQQAAKNGIEHSSYIVDLDIYEEDEVRDFIVTRAAQINNYMQGSADLPPIPDDPEDVWQGRLCREFCPVAHLCNINGDNQYLKYQEEEEE